MPRAMEGVLRALLSIRSVDFDSFDIGMPESPFKPIGVATAVPDFGIHAARTYIWHAPSEILPITRSELERFEMDAPDGFHLILSERTTHSDCDTVDRTKFQIVSPKQVSQWIGNAVLSGDLIASAVPEESNGVESNDFSTYSNEEGIQILNSKIDIDSWTTNRGIEGFSSSPILLEARIWRVSGDLHGPSGSSEKGEWTILEDPWSQRLSIIGESESMQKSPKIRSIEPPVGNWFSEDRLKIEISKIVEERRRGDSGEVSFSGTVRSMLLEKWVLDMQMAIIEHQRIFIPGWLLIFESEKILHGRNGRLYDLVSLK
tara:strand:- start:94 stop:1044 length:951 start_codon:yes stop_codon:yes gene_type:complete